MSYSSFTPVDPDFYDIIKSQQNNEDLVVHFFNHKGDVETARGKIEKIISPVGMGDFLLFDNDQKVRLDRIVTFNGRPGPAYDEYDSFALQCMECMGGMD